MMKTAGISPRDLHSIWQLLRSNTSFENNQIEEIGSALFQHITKEEMQRLLNIACQLSLVSKTDSGWKTKEDGIKYCSLKHWRYWDNHSLARQFGLENYFIAEKKRPLVIDLFSGSGGLGLGFEKAGFSVAVAIDNDKQATEAHRLNFPECHTIMADIHDITKNPKKNLCEKFGLVPEDISGIIGGPPCQGFSFIGERNNSDERNLLTTAFMDVVLDIEPDFFVMENVAGLMSSGKMPPFSTHFVRLAKNIGIPATGIVDSLPIVPASAGKRDRQYRKKMISKLVDENKQFIKLKLQDSRDISYHGLAVIAIDNLYNLLIERISALYGEAEAIALCSKNPYRLLIAQIVLASIFEAASSLKILKEKDATSFLDCVTTHLRDKGTSEIRSVITLIKEEYVQASQGQEYAKYGPVLTHLIDRASEKYNVATPKVLNSAWFGAPQSRERMFLVGVHKRQGKSFSFPPQIYAVTGKERKASSLPNAPAVLQAIGDLPDIDDYEELINSDVLPSTNLKEAVAPYTKFMRLEAFESGDNSLPRFSWNPYVTNNCKRTLHAPEIVKRIQEMPEGKQDAKSHRTRLNREAVSHTLRAGTKEGKGSHTAIRPIHYEYNRVISVREGARIMGYPDWMTFHEAKWHGFRLVGNGVPAHLGSAVAKRIMGLLYADN